MRRVIKTNGYGAPAIFAISAEFNDQSSLSVFPPGNLTQLTAIRDTITRAYILRHRRCVVETEETEARDRKAAGQ